MVKVPQTVELVNFVDPEEKKPKADKPITVSKAEFERRLEIRPGEVRVWRDDQRPEFKEKRIRKRKCPYCGYDFRGLKTVCPRCKNCQACGSYTGPKGDLLCPICGNSDRKKIQSVPTINIG